MTTMAMDPRLKARRIEVMRLQGRRRLRVLISTVAVLASAVAMFGVTRSPLLDVDTIEVEGASRTPEQTIMDLAEPLVSQPLLEAKISAVVEEIEALPWVEEVSSDRDLDGTVTFHLIESEAVAAVAGTDGWLLVDADGRVLDQVATVPDGIAAVDGLAWRTTLGDWIPERALPGVEVASSIPPGLADEVSSIRLGASPEEGTLLVLETGGIIVLGPNLDLDQKFVAAATIIDQVSLRCVDRIDVRAPSVPVLTRDPACS